MGAAVTLCEEIILLTVSDDGALLRRHDDISVRAAVSGACLVELALLGRLDNDLERIYVVNGDQTGEPHLDLALDKLGGKGSVRALDVGTKTVFDQAPNLYRLALTRLIERGILAQTEDTFLWVLKTRRYPPIDDQVQTEAKQKIFNILTGKTVPTPEEIALVSLAVETDILKLFMSEREIGRLEGRIQQIAHLDITLQAILEISTAFKAQMAAALATPYY